MMKTSQILLLIISLILSIILLLSIILIHFIPLKENDQKRSLLNPLMEPCQCGCQSIQPLFNNQKGRIINGESSRSHSWPWQMILLIIDVNRNPISYCGATLITDRHILTAAHCVHQHIPPFIYLFPGKDLFYFNESLTSGYRINRIYIHEQFNVLLHHDIAILTIEQPLRFDSFIYPICLPKPNSTLLKLNDELVVIGWGRTSLFPQNHFYSEELQQIKVNYIPLSHPNCSKVFQPITNIHPGQMCAGKEGFNACLGDSGGPIMRQIFIQNTNQSYWEQIGIASKTIDCGLTSNSPDIYTFIPYYYQWIIQTIQRT